MVGMVDWDRDLPNSVDDVIALLQRRIQVHRYWAEFIHNDPDRSRAAVNAGVGTEESHRRYALQYEAAIKVLERLGDNK